MTDLFLKIVNMSISATWLVLAVLVLRLLLKKAPKWINVILWGIVALRLICPLSVESVLSLIPSAETISPEIMLDPSPAIHSGISVINSAVNPVLSHSFSPAPGDSANPLQIWIPVLAVVWIAGMALMLLYTAVSYGRLRSRMKEAVLLRDNIYQSENAASPFVLGILKPRIYLPYQMPEQAAPHVIAHEQAHIQRKDHWWKPFGFLLLTIHWFNPVMWIAYILLCRDIELACDERVIQELGAEQRADYSQALLTCSVSRRSIAACPLAFGEVGVKERVKSVLNYKKPGFWMVLIAVMVCIAVAVCFLTNPRGDSQNTDPTGKSSLYPALEELPADYTLEQAKLDGCVVMEDGDVTSGQEVWQSFLAAAQNGEASVRLVHYYPLDDPERYDPEFYASIQDEYPMMFVLDLVFDGSFYTIRWHEHGEEIAKTYRYLMCYTGKPVSPYAVYESHIRYVLTNDDTVSWEELLAGTLSSQQGAYIDFFDVYTDLIYG